VTARDLEDSSGQVRGTGDVSLGATAVGRGSCPARRSLFGEFA
jgi:hypothetical protein